MHKSRGVWFEESQRTEGDVCEVHGRLGGRKNFDAKDLGSSMN